VTEEVTEDVREAVTEDGTEDVTEAVTEDVPADLAADTRVEALGEGRYQLTLSDHWDYLLPSGGVVQTVALRAAAAELADPRFRLYSSTATFCTPVQRGDLELAVQVLRRGTSMAQLRVDLRNRGAELAAVVTATFGVGRAGPDVIGAAMPAVRPLDAAPPADDLLPGDPGLQFRFNRQVERRIADGESLWQDGWPPGPARYARWFRYRVPQRGADGKLDRLALPPLLDTMPSALQRAIGPSYRFYAPSLDLTVHVVDDTERQWLLLASYVRRALAGIAIGEIEAWDDRGKLVAFASQAMYLRSLTGEPPVIDASRR
jgi:acyl-CoA thioesterase